MSAYLLCFIVFLPTWWTWVWVNSGSRWWTGKPGMLQSLGSQRVRHDWETELNWRSGQVSWLLWYLAGVTDFESDRMKKDQKLSEIHKILEIVISHIYKVLHTFWWRLSLVSTSYKQHLHWVSQYTMAPHSSTFAWKISWAEEPGRLQSLGSLRVGHDWATSLSLFSFMHWRSLKWQPTPVFLPGESHGRRSLVGCSPWGR